MLQEKTFDTGEVIINYAEGPASGEPLIMLHGVAARWQSGVPLMPSLMSRWHVYALDFRGHGKSGRVPGTYQIPSYARDVTRFVQQVIQRPVVIFGHSLGGRVALALAAELPDMVRALVIADTPLTTKSLGEQAEFFKAFGSWREIALSDLSLDGMVAALAGLPVAPGNPESSLTFGEVSGWDQAYLRFTARHLRLVDPEILADMETGPAGVASQMDVLGMLPQVTCPTLFLQGNPELGGLLKEDDVLQALSVMPSAIRVRIDRAGHDIHLQDAEAACRAVMFFLESI
jgi:pimeloyl-ACP methyl ester carboxylesterase